MQLTMYTDYALRVLMALGAVAPDKLTVGQISEAYGISLNHLLKVVQHLSALGYTETLRGKAGGVRLARAPEEIRLGAIVRELEPELGLVSCLRTGEAPCVIAPVCRLRSVLQEATARFLSELDQHTLADFLKPKARIQQLLTLP